MKYETKVIENKASTKKNNRLRTANFRSNPVALENARPGTTDWKLENPSLNHEIEGYANQTSYRNGESVTLFVHCASPEFIVQVFRMGWYDSLAGRCVLGPIRAPGSPQRKPPVQSQGLYELCWEASFVLEIPQRHDDDAWVSGVYLVKLTTIPRKAESYIMFVVRDEDDAGDILFQSSVNTFQAYNSYGGKSLYQHSSEGGKACAVSFNRPYGTRNHGPAAFGAGAAEFLVGEGGWEVGGGWEYCTLRFLEREGYDVRYCTSIDTHSNRQLIARHRLFISGGHDEYWTDAMRSNVTSAMQKGTHLAFLGANACYWEVRLEPDTKACHEYRTLVCHRYETDGAPQDTGRESEAVFSGPRTLRWRDTVPGYSRSAMPEQELIGAMYNYPCSNADDDILLRLQDHWIFDSISAGSGKRLRGLLGYECDRIHGRPSPDTIVLAESPYSGAVFESRRRTRRLLGDHNLRRAERMATGAALYLTRFLDRYGCYLRPRRIAHMTLMEKPSGGMVFCTGSMNWCYGLDDWGVQEGYRESKWSPIAQQMTRNYIDRCLGSPQGVRSAGAISHLTP